MNNNNFVADKESRTAETEAEGSHQAPAWNSEWAFETEHRMISKQISHYIKDIRPSSSTRRSASKVRRVRGRR